MQNDRLFRISHHADIGKIALLYVHPAILNDDLHIGMERQRILLVYTQLQTAEILLFGAAERQNALCRDDDLNVLHGRLIGKIHAYVDMGINFIRVEDHYAFMTFIARILDGLCFRPVTIHYIPVFLAARNSTSI